MIKMRKIQFYILLLILMAILFSSCGSAPEKLPINGTESSGISVDTSKSSDIQDIRQYTRDNSKALKIFKNLFSSDTMYTAGRNMFDEQNSFVIDNTLYILTGYQSRIGFFEVNPVTGNLEPICRDPLCQHKTDDCVMNTLCTGATTNGKDVFTSNVNAISKVNLAEGKISLMCSWRASQAMSDYATCDEKYVYFVASTSDTTNEFFRVPVNGGKPEQLSKLDDSIVTFTVSDGYILFRNSVGTLKLATLDFSSTETIAEKTATMTSENGLFFYCDDFGRINEISIDNIEPKIVAENVAHYRGFLCDGLLYYYKTDFKDSKKIYCYDVNSGSTDSIELSDDIILFNTHTRSFDSEKIFFYDDVDNLSFFGKYGDYLLIYMYDKAIHKYEYELPRFFLLKTDGTEIAEIFFEEMPPAYD